MWWNRMIWKKSWREIQFGKRPNTKSEGRKLITLILNALHHFFRSEWCSTQKWSHHRRRKSHHWVAIHVPSQICSSSMKARGMKPASPRPLPYCPEMVLPSSCHVVSSLQKVLQEPWGCRRGDRRRLISSSRGG